MQNSVFITWLHLSMLIDIHTPLVLFQTKYLLTHVMVRLLILIQFPFPVLTIAIFKLSVEPFNKSFYHKTIPPTKMSMQTMTTTNPSEGYTKEADAIFETHNSAHRLIEDHLSLINARMLNLTCQIATLRENAEGYVCIDPRY